MGVFGAIHLLTRKTAFDPLLAIYARTFITITLAAIADTLLYFVVGGWGWPSPEVFAFIGFIGGPIAFFIARRRQILRQQGKIS
jgi:hypothetical protein